MYLSGQANNHAGVTFATQSILPTTQGTVNNNIVDLGQNGNAYKDLYLGGGAYLGGTGSANKLEDYEIGTYNPQYLATGSSGSNAYSYQTGIYTKVGRLCRVWVDFNITSSSGMSGTPCISLPFTSSSTGDMGSFTPWDISNNFTSSRHVTQWMNPNTDIMLMYTWAGDSNTGHTVLQINTTGRISGGLMYQTN